MKINGIIRDNLPRCTKNSSFRFGGWVSIAPPMKPCRLWHRKFVPRFGGWVCIALLVTIGLVWATSWHIQRGLPHESVALAWGQGARAYVQCSVYFENATLVDERKIEEMRNAIVMELRELEWEDMPVGRLWLDAYSAEESIDIRHEEVFKEGVRAYGVGGDFFTFHEKHLLSGSFFTEEDIMQNRVVVSEDLAWQLFGSADIEGKVLWIANEAYFICGVVEKESGLFADKAGNHDLEIYMPFEAFYDIAGIPVSCYEVILPNPIQNYGRSLLYKALGLSEYDATEYMARNGLEVVENSSRFSVPRIWQNILNYGIRSMKFTQIKYPNWENRARGCEDVVALLYVVATLCTTLLLFAVMKAVKMQYHKKKTIAQGFTVGAISKVQGAIKRKVSSAKQYLSEKRIGKQR